jgi:DNA polymerase (family 10)
MKNQQIAKIFNEIAELLELKGENVFRIRAYRRAAQNLDGLAKDVATLTDEELVAIPGIGKDLGGKVREHLETGRIAKHEELKKDIPAGVLELLAVPGLGPKKAMLFFDRLKISSVDALEEAIRAGRLSGLPGVQKKTEENILRSIASLKRRGDRTPLGRALPLAEDIVRRLKEAGGVERIEVAGSIRRRKETVKDIDILVTSREPGRVMDAFTVLPHADRVLAKGETRSSIVTAEGMQVDLRVVEEGSFGAALQYFTGSKEHNIRLREMAVKAGLKINEYGVFRGEEERKVGGKREEDIYRALDLPWVPPELREDRGEIDAARQGRLPQLVELKDIRGDLHVHTKASDGMHDLAEIIGAAERKGYAYIAVTDHTKGLGVAHGLDETRLAGQGKAIEAANRKMTGFRVLKGTETDIRADGRLDLADAALAELDIVVASIHGGFTQPREQLTKRLLAAVRSPWVSVIAHPTGRLIGEREPYDVDIDAVLREAARYGVAMEVNAYPLRLDLNDAHVRMAKDLGVPLVISTDTHVATQFEFMAYGVATARRGWAERSDVLNTLTYDQLMRRLRAIRAKKQAG